MSQVFRLARETRGSIPPGGSLFSRGWMESRGPFILGDLDRGSNCTRINGPRINFRGGGGGGSNCPATPAL